MEFVRRPLALVFGAWKQSVRRCVEMPRAVIPCWRRGQSKCKICRSSERRYTLCNLSLITGQLNASRSVKSKISIWLPLTWTESAGCFWQSRGCLESSFGISTMVRMAVHHRGSSLSPSYRLDLSPPLWGQLCCPFGVNFALTWPIRK